MASLNKKSTTFSDVRLAGGGGGFAAKQNNLAELKRSVLSCLLWEDLAYEKGGEVAKNICRLIPLVSGEECANLAIQARNEQQLRHVPLLIASEMCKYASHKKLVSKVLAQIIQRPDELGEFLSIYWRDGKMPIANQAKKGLGDAFKKFDEYSLAKWNRAKDVKLRDVLRLIHPTPDSPEQGQLWKKVLDDQLKTPDTWEVGLSAAKSAEEKRDVWVRLIDERKLGALALLKNLRNMQDVKVPKDKIRAALANCNPRRLLPIDFIRAVTNAPDFTRELETLMFSCVSMWPKLYGSTVLVVDVSGSMGISLSSRSDYSRLDSAISLAMLASEVSEHITVYITAGSDQTRTHKTEKIIPVRGFGLIDQIKSRARTMGGGGIFTAQCMEYLRSKEYETPDRIIVFSDSQDCELHKRAPQPFGRHNYIIDISSHSKGINYAGVWTAEITSYSEFFLSYIAELEKLVEDSPALN